MIVPPTSDLSGPYAAAPRLLGWLRSLGHDAEVVDLSIELFLRIFCSEGLTRLFACIDPKDIRSDYEDVYEHRGRYVQIIDQAIAFAQGRDLAPRHLIVRPGYLPEGPAFTAENAENRRSAFGDWGITDLARHLLSLMFADLVELFKMTISPNFGMVAYGSKLSDTKTRFDDLHADLNAPPNEIDRMLTELAAETLDEDFDLACFTCPFPGNLYGALSLGKWLGEHRPQVQRALGGGYPSTELRDLSDPRVFDAMDYIVLDDGELPLQQICARVAGEDAPLVRTFVREGDEVVYHEGSSCEALKFRELPAPDYRGIDLDRYISVLYMRNRTSQLLSEGIWLKLTAAHGCYWKKCTFCDIHLPYIGDFDPLSASSLADQMDALHEQTGLTGFHFTDEAAPPSLLVKLALELLRRGRNYQFWGNIRYDTAFTPDRCRLLAAAGMIAVTGGIEIASDELLPKIRKGITVRQVINVLNAFSSAGIITHAYLIQGFPGETKQDTVNSLEIMRQMMKANILHSAFYHQFVPTKHSPVGKNPELYQIRVVGPKDRGFASYALNYVPEYKDAALGTRLHSALQRAMLSYARGEHLDVDVSTWLRGLDFPPTEIPPEFVTDALKTTPADGKKYRHVCWLGGTPSWSKGLLNITCGNGEILSSLTPKQVADNLARVHPSGWTSHKPPLVSEFESMAWTKPYRSLGLVLV
jgi:radical SAM superfamily enzyme YgiQ (UPF0313 family)